MVKTSSQHARMVVSRQILRGSTEHTMAHTRVSLDREGPHMRAADIVQVTRAEYLIQGARLDNDDDVCPQSACPLSSSEMA
jgi:hypothetical protein